MAKVMYDMEPCRRCGGTGEYSFNAIDGSRCYGCGGGGKQRTKQAQQAAEVLGEYVQRHAMVPVIDVKVGDRVHIATGMGRERWATVTKVEVRHDRPATMRKGDDVWTTDTQLGITVDERYTVNYALFDGRPHLTLRVAFTDAQRAEYLALAGTLAGVQVVE
jgi:hypothetical protein